MVLLAESETRKCIFTAGNIASRLKKGTVKFLFQNRATNYFQGLRLQYKNYGSCAVS